MTCVVTAQTGAHESHQADLDVFVAQSHPFAPVTRPCPRSEPEALVTHEVLPAARLCVTIDADTEDNGAMNNMRAYYPAHGNNNNTGDAVQALVGCAGAERWRL